MPPRPLSRIIAKVKELSVVSQEEFEREALTGPIFTPWWILPWLFN